MSILGIDYGAKKIGVAKADPTGGPAVPLTTLLVTNQSEGIEQLQQLIASEGAERLVVGVPVSLSPSGAELLRDKDHLNKQMQEVLQFIEQLKTAVDIPVELEDERFSTKLAHGMQKELVKINGDDAVAAMVILQSYLDRKKL